MGGLATGLAVGAGVMAAESIGRHLMGGEEHHNQNYVDPNAGANYAPQYTGNNDMGGQDFGVRDAGSWDDAGSAGNDFGSGGDWDN